MTDRFVVREGASPTIQGTVFVGHGTKLLTGRTRLVLREGLRLLFEQSREGALKQSLSGSLSDLLEGEQIEIQGWALIAKSPAGDDFAPLGGKITEILEFLGCW